MTNSYTQIDTPRLQLKMLQHTDAKDLQQLLATNKQFMIPYIPWAKNEPETIVEKENKIREWQTDFYRGTKYIYGVFNRLNNKMIGLFFVFTRQGDNILEIGYIIDHLQAGKGYATEGSYALTKLCFEKIKIDKVVIICNTNNIASAKIPEKLGYTLNSDEIKNRHEDSVWVQLIKGFKEIKKYSPIYFTMDK